MRLTRTIRGLATICAVVIAGVVLTASPASANHSDITGLFGGSFADQTEWYYDIHLQIQYDPNNPGYSLAYTSLSLEIGQNAVVTGATDCRVETWITLDDGHTTWDSPHANSHTCLTMLNNPAYRGVLLNEGHIGPFDTVALYAKGQANMYIYYNGSSTPGWTRQVQGVWTQTDSNP